MVRLGGKFTLSDDIHRVAHVRTNYELAVEFLEALGLNEVHFFERQDGGSASKTEFHLVPIPVQLSVVKASLLRTK